MAITVVQFTINCLPLRIMNRVSWVSFFWMLFGSLILVIGLPSIAPQHQSWKWVFTKWYEQDAAIAPGELVKAEHGRAPNWSQIMRTGTNPLGPVLSATGLPTTGWSFCAVRLHRRHRTLPCSCKLYRRAWI